MAKISPSRRITWKRRFTASRSLPARYRARSARISLTSSRSQLLDRVKHLDKSKLKDLFNIVAQAIKHKDLQVYLTDPRAELLLQQLGLASEVNRGSGDSVFVNDANIGGNKANMYVTQHQTDVVTLLPNGGAIHHLQIATTFDKKGYIYNGTT